MSFFYNYVVLCAVHKLLNFSKASGNKFLILTIFIQISYPKIRLVYKKNRLFPKYNLEILPYKKEIKIHIYSIFYNNLLPYFYNIFF